MCFPGFKVRSFKLKLVPLRRGGRVAARRRVPRAGPHRGGALHVGIKLTHDPYPMAFQTHNL
jgi:hypothetical protein